MPKCQTVLGFCGTECGYRPAQTFTCDWCREPHCWCQGACDQIERTLGPICDDCAAKHNCIRPECDPDHDRCEPCCRRADSESSRHHAAQNVAWAAGMAVVFGDE